LVQCTGAAGSGLTASATFASAVTAGHLIVAWSANYGGGATSVKDSINNIAYTQDILVGGGATNSGIYTYLAASGGSSFAVTLTATSSSYPSIVIAEFAFSGTSSGDGTSVGSSGTGTSPATSALALSGKDLVLSALSFGAAGTVSAGSGFTSAYQVPYSAGINVGLMGQYILNAGAGSVTPSASTTASSAWAISGVAFIQSGGASEVFTVSALDGLGAGGPFFASPMSRI
jgi:hypothetical protein